MGFFAKIIEFFRSLFGGKRDTPTSTPDPVTTTTTTTTTTDPVTPDPPVDTNGPGGNSGSGNGGNNGGTNSNSGGGDTIELLITKAKLKEILSTKEELIDRYLIPLNQALHHYQVNTPLRIAHFIAQVGHESGSFRYHEEIWPNPQLDANGVAQNGNKWQLRYEGNEGLGNTEVGDGYRFRGRGLIQLTGRGNYTRYGKFLGKNLTDGDNPGKVAQPELAADAAGWFWMRRKLNTYADRDDVLTITKRINGGTNGLSDRKRLLQLAKKALGI